MSDRLDTLTSQSFIVNERLDTIETNLMYLGLAVTLVAVSAILLINRNLNAKS